MQVLFLILKQVGLMNDILHELAEAGVRGGTILDAKGMGESLLSMDDIPMVGVLRHLLSNEEKEDVKIFRFVDNYAYHIWSNYFKINLSSNHKK